MTNVCGAALFTLECDIQAGDALVDCVVYVELGDDPRDMRENDCKDSKGDTEFDFLTGRETGISNDIEVGRFVGLVSENVSEVGEKAAMACRFDPDLGVGVGEYSIGSGGGQRV